MEKWSNQLKNISQDASMYIRYVGQCKYPKTPTKRFDEDCKKRYYGCIYHFFNHFRQANQGILDNGKAFFLNNLDESYIDQNCVDK
jgi:hypothetical protein